MNIVERTKTLMLSVGASPVMYTMIGLSVVSVAVMIERGWFFHRAQGDLDALARGLDDQLQKGDLEAARQQMREAGTVEASVVLAGLDRAAGGARAAEEAMIGATALQRVRLERRLAFLGTLGNNAPFIGLLGTVVGIIQAFEALGRPGAQVGTASNAVMGSIAEALVATAIGLLVAIPAVAAFNWFQRRIKTIVASTEALTRILLSHLEAQGAAHAPHLVALPGREPHKPRHEVGSRSESGARISVIPASRPRAQEA
jgi:biopolymer transport protein ExbB